MRIYELYPKSRNMENVFMQNVLMLSKEFRILKESDASEFQFAGWRRSVRERFGPEAAGLLEATRLHVLGMEAVEKIELRGCERNDSN